MSQDFQQSTDSLLINDGFNTTTSYSTGSVCQFSGTYVAKNKYMDLFGLYAKGEIFRVGPDGKKTTWTALTPTLSTNNDGGFNSVKVSPGTA
jgi:hypothetical protein